MKKQFLFLLVVLLFVLPAFSQPNPFGRLEEYDKSETVKKANRKLKSGDVDGALKILDKAIERKVDLYEAYRKRYLIRFYHVNNIDGALADLDKAIEIKPEDVWLYINRSHLKKKYKKDYAGALRDYEAAQKHAPDSLILFQSKAELKEELKDFEGAMAELQIALKKFPGNIALNIYVSSLLEQKNEPEKAITHLQGFLDNYVMKAGKLPSVKGEKVKKKIPGEYQESSGTKSRIPVRRYSQMSFYATSWQDLQKQMEAIEEVRSLSEAFITLAKMYVARNEIDKAFNNLHTALEIDKNQEEAYSLRGVLYLSKNEFERAVVELSRAIDIAEEPSFYLNRGIAYLAVANEKKAQSDFAHFLKLYPEGKAILDQRINEINQLKKENQTKPK